MTWQRLLLAAVITGLAAPSVLAPSQALAQSRGDVITPPPTKSDGSVIPPPAAHADPGIEKGKPPEQSQLPEGKDRPHSDDAPVPAPDKGR
jgi:hypothetical protein